MKEDSAINLLAIILFKVAQNPNSCEKKWHPAFSLSMSKHNLTPKNQFQQANPTGGQNLTLWPLIDGTSG